MLHLTQERGTGCSMSVHVNRVPDTDFILVIDDLSLDPASVGAKYVVGLLTRAVWLAQHGPPPPMPDHLRQDSPLVPCDLPSLVF